MVINGSMIMAVKSSIKMKKELRKKVFIAKYKLTSIETYIKSIWCTLLAAVKMNFSSVIKFDYMYIL